MLKNCIKFYFIMMRFKNSSHILLKFIFVNHKIIYIFASSSFKSVHPNLKISNLKWQTKTLYLVNIKFELILILKYEI